jgi:hypothetical protein
MAHPFGLTDEEYEALLAVREGKTPRDAADPVWITPLLLDLVWIDPSCEPAAMRLTTSGSRYPLD